MSPALIASQPVIRALKGVPASFKLAAFALLQTKYGTLTFDLPDGRQLVFKNEAEGPEARVIIHDYAFVKRALASGDVGFAESYMDEQWSTPDLTEVLRFFSANFDLARKVSAGGAVMRAINLVRHVLQNTNSRAGARKNIMAHYDLGNSFYAMWLDPSMTYSSALFTSPNQNLEQAQQNKYASICDRLNLKPDAHVLEIGCGWGGFAEYAASQRGARLTCLTISPAQRDFAAERLQKAGLSERVDIRLEDYRDHRGSYDGIASIEMFEAVGEAYWPSYFERVHDALKPEGRAALQIITIDDSLFERYRKRVDFIQRHIFPGGMLPSDAALKAQFAAAGLKQESRIQFGADYARTCKEWSRAFSEHWSEISKLGFNEPFRRLWNFYLSYCEAGFADGRINVGQYQLVRA